MVICSIRRTHGSDYTWCFYWHRIYVEMRPFPNSRLYIEDLEASTKYTVKLSYPGSIPVQYEVFFEDDDSEATISSSIHKRRIQDTRILSFETNQHGRIFKKDAESGQIVSLLPFLFIISRAIISPFYMWFHVIWPSIELPTTPVSVLWRLSSSLLSSEWLLQSGSKRVCSLFIVCSFMKFHVRLPPDF